MITLLNTDNIKYMKDVPDKYFDLGIVDIEYNIGASKPSIKPCSVKQRNGSTLYVKQPNYVPKEWDFKKSSKEYFKQLFRISKNQIVFGGNYYGLEGGYLVWDKLNGDSDQFGCELAWLSFTKRTDIVYYLWSGMFQGVYCGKNIQKALVQQGNKALNEIRIHVTQKPVLIYKYILKEYAKPEFKIIDTHGGSMSSVIAAYDFGISEMVCCEIDKEIFEAAEQRFKIHKMQSKIQFK
jgi:site-specific DNA-methyltransferase (adenine-specific)